MKYQISYTLKLPGKQGFFEEKFKTKKAAQLWLKNESNKLYWHQLTEINPKSTKPRHIIQFDPSEAYTKKYGTLQTHFETGMECMGLVFYEDGIHSGPNPNFDSTKPESRSNFKYYASYDGLTFINNGHIIEFSDGVKIGMAKDRDFAKKDGYRLSFYPQGFTKKEWVELFTPENIKVILWIKNK